MHSLNYTALRAAKRTLTLCALILLLSGCASLGAKTNGPSRAGTLPPAPTTPGAMVTEQYICIPHNEAAELMLWIEAAEEIR